MGNPGQAAQPAHPHVLGHSEHEVERLKAQARLIDPITERFFRAAGVGAGMRVLDVGSGAGDVAFLASDIAGAGGSVVGVETLVERMSKEAGASSSVLIGHHQIAAWVRV